MIHTLRGLIAAALLAPALAVAVPAGPATAGQVHADVPDRVDPKLYYVIYLHGGWPETHPLSEPHPKRGLFQYNAIVAALAARDLEVISQLRRDKTNPRKYARERVVAQVKALIAKGVPADRITVAGFSKGGAMSLIVAALAKEPKLNFVNMAGCGKGQFRIGYERFLAEGAVGMQGRMLSIFDEADQIGGTCKEAFEKAPRLITEEIVLKVGQGHGTFYAPNPAWLDPVAAWARGPAAAPKAN